MYQRFKGDEVEEKFIEAGGPAFDLVNTQVDMFWAGAYETYALGDMIWESKRAPLTNAITKEIFRSSFKEIFDAFIDAGTFESYITVFQKIFGVAVEIDFTVPGPGKLLINVEATGDEIYLFLARRIESLTYEFDHIVDENGDHILFESFKGFDTQYELQQMLTELVPGGVWTQVTLSIV